MKKINAFHILCLLLMVSCGNTDNGSVQCDGKDYCFIFATVTTNNGDVDTNNDGNPIIEADAICNADASKPNSASYKALIVDGTNRQVCSSSDCRTTEKGRIDWVLESSREYRQVDGTTIIGTTSLHSVFTFDLTNVFSSVTNESWTGLDDNFQTNSVNCSAFKVTTGNGSAGNQNSKTVNSINSADESCANLNRFICIEQP
jgi:hypothetical protein